MKKIYLLFIVIAAMAFSLEIKAQSIHAVFNAGDKIWEQAYDGNYDEMSEISSDFQLMPVQYGYSDFPYELLYRKLTMNDLYGLDCSQLRVLRNSIYAYYGYIFKSDDLRWFFSQFDWYNPRYRNEGKVSAKFSKIEKYNIDFIKKRERQLGC